MLKGKVIVTLIIICACDVRQRDQTGCYFNGFVQVHVYSTFTKLISFICRMQSLKSVFRTPFVEWKRMHQRGDKS